MSEQRCHTESRPAPCQLTADGYCGVCWLCREEAQTWERANAVLEASKRTLEESQRFFASLSDETQVQS